MIEFDVTVRIGRNPDQVFAVLSDFEAFMVCGRPWPVQGPSRS